MKSLLIFLLCHLCMLSAYSQSTETNYREVITDKGGELAEKLKDCIDDIDSLVVKGNINDADFKTLWKASLYGKLSVINLKDAVIDNETVPDNAFWDFDEQVHIEEGTFTSVMLRRIIFPEGLKHIGSGAFQYARRLEDINIPSTLQSIGNEAFYECLKLKTDPLVFPEGFETIGDKAFFDCRSLKGRVVLPSTMKKINDQVFYQAKVGSVVFPDQLETIGDYSFYGCMLKEAIIPNTCQHLKGSGHFCLNRELEKLHIPEGIETIPMEFANGCEKLKEVDIPSTVKEIGNRAFAQCAEMTNLELPDGLETIGEEAFAYMYALEEIVFPASLKSLGAESCNGWSGMKRIYCMATEPPVCEKSSRSERTPFGVTDSGYKFNDVPLYVPVGSADKYRNAWGWSFFKNIIETGDFPTAIHGVTERIQKASNDIYDLSGRKVVAPCKGRIYVVNGKKVVW